MSVDEERAGEALRSLMLTMELPPSRSDSDPVEDLAPRRTGPVLAMSAAAVVGVAGVLATIAVVGTHDRAGPVHGAAAAGDAVKCERPQPLLVSGFSGIRVAATDRSGRYVVGDGAPRGGGARQMLLWLDGKATPVHVPAGSGPVDVNSSGVVAGGLHTYPPDKSVAWVYRDGQLHMLPPPSGFQYVSTVAVNERGDVAGTAAGPGDTLAAIVWPAGTPDTPVVLSAPSAAVAEDIADDGTVVGNLYESGSSAGGLNAGEAYVWSAGGAGRQLDTPAGWAAAKALRVEGDWIYGYTHDGVKAEINTDPSGPYIIARAAARWRLDDGALVELPAHAKETIISTMNAGWWLKADGEPLMVTTDGRAIRVDLGDPEINHSLERLDTWVVGDISGEFVMYGHMPVKRGDSNDLAIRWTCRG